jgi:hypothetical protein
MPSISDAIKSSSFSSGVSSGVGEGGGAGGGGEAAGSTDGATVSGLFSGAEGLFSGGLPAQENSRASIMIINAHFRITVTVPLTHIHKKSLAF